MEDDILIELLSVVDVRLIEGVNDLKAFRSMCVVRKGYNGDLGLDRGVAAEIFRIVPDGN
jgi:hypothetical protein